MSEAVNGLAEVREARCSGSVFLNHGENLTFSQLQHIAHGASLEFDDRHWDAVAEGRAFLERMIAERRRIYGVTTGYGPLANTYVDPEASAELQRGLVNHLSSGVGPLFEAPEVRAMTAARAATLARGHSAVRPETLRLMLDCLDADLVPHVPTIGTVGASGDLTPLAHITLALTGQGRVWLRGVDMSAREAFEQTGLQPLDPEGKDALALVNGTSAMTGVAGLNAGRARRSVQLSVLLTILHGEALGGHREALAPNLSRVRPHPGQLWAQQALWRASEGTRRLASVEQPPARLPDGMSAGQALHQQPLPQDAYTFRCAPQHLGAVVDALLYHEQVVSRELYAVTDNPVFFPDQEVVLHGGNFFGQHVALASDALNNALLTLAVHSERRIARITDPGLSNGLPPFLRGNDNGCHSGFMGAQVTATALVAELRTHANPASIQSIPTNANNQDVVTMGTVAARRCSWTLQRLSELLAIEALVLAQGYDLRGGAKAGFCPSSRALAGWVRERAEHLENDRPLWDDISNLAASIANPMETSALFDKHLMPWPHAEYQP